MKSIDLNKLPEYELIYKQTIDELGSDGYLLKHKKSGARVVLMNNDDDNKVFYIGFRTTPKDSTGVMHILEHSVLCGSQEFPVKDPFIELAKGSLNTFLNAMTFPDKTMYPVASTNIKDLYNLIDVYMDAVFFPNIYKNKKRKSKKMDIENRVEKQLSAIFAIVGTILFIVGIALGIIIICIFIFDRFLSWHPVFRDPKVSV